MKEVQIRELEFEKILSGIFIVAAVLNIYADGEAQKYIFTDDEIKNKNAKNAFVIAIIISILIYIYFVYRNYKNFVNKKEHGNSNLEFLRLVGSLSILIGSVIILYYELNENNQESSPII